MKYLGEFKVERPVTGNEGQAQGKSSQRQEGRPLQRRHGVDFKPLIREELDLCDSIMVEGSKGKRNTSTPGPLQAFGINIKWICMYGSCSISNPELRGQ